MSTTTDKVKELGITKGEWKVAQFGYPNGIEDSLGRVVAGAAMDNRYYDHKPGDPPSIGPKEAEANARLIANAGTTANKSGCLPSELLEQRDEAIRLLEDIRLSYVSGIGHEAFGEVFTRNHIDKVGSFLTRIKQGKP